MDNMIIYDDNYNVSPDLREYFSEMKIDLNSLSEKERLFKLFRYFIDRGHDQAAADLVDFMLRKRLIAKPL